MALGATRRQQGKSGGQEGMQGGYRDENNKQHFHKQAEKIELDLLIKGKTLVTEQEPCGKNQYLGKMSLMFLHMEDWRIKRQSKKFS